MVPEGFEPTSLNYILSALTIKLQNLFYIKKYFKNKN